MACSLAELVGQIAARLESDAALRRHAVSNVSQQRFAVERRRELAAKGNTPKPVEATARDMEIIAERCTQSATWP